MNRYNWGIFSTAGTPPRVGLSYGEYVVDMPALAEQIDFGFEVSVFRQPVLNPFIRLGREVTIKARTQGQAFLDSVNDQTPKPYLVPLAEATLHLPLQIGDYTDFYSSIDHATNVGKLFRDPENALLPNWRHLPVGYHGRASSITVSGTPVRRPRGQITPALPQCYGTVAAPDYLPTDQLDFELEMAFVIGKDSELGHPVPIDRAEDHIFGLALLNDWSARDIQRWEYVPLGPFLGKSFASTLSPWIVPLEALEPARVAGPNQEPEPLAYLRTSRPGHFDIHLEATLETAAGTTHTLCRTNHRHLYWSMVQQLAHHTSNGCNLRVGDLLASGTISGPEPGSYGSLLEITRAGRQPLTLPDGTQRAFLQDGDRITLSAHTETPTGDRLDFGPATAQILPAHDL